MRPKKTVTKKKASSPALNVSSSRLGRDGKYYSKSIGVAFYDEHHDKTDVYLEFMPLGTDEDGRLKITVWHTPYEKGE